MTTINVPRELIERAIKDEQSWPRLDGNWACVGCGNWMPKGHPEAHEHEEGCQEEALAKQRHWRSQLRALLAEQTQAGAGQSLVESALSAENQRIVPVKPLLADQHPLAARHDQGDEVRRLREALEPFAALAQLFDDGARGGTMPETGAIAAWPRLGANRELIENELTVEHLRAARAALSAQQQEGDGIQMLHEPHNRAMWHTNCPGQQFSQPMKPIGGGVWECARCRAKAQQQASKEPDHE